MCTRDERDSIDEHERRQPIDELVARAPPSLLSVSNASVPLEHASCAYFSSPLIESVLRIRNVPPVADAA